MDKLSLFGADVARALGHEDQRLSIVTSVILAIISFFYIFTLGSFINANVFLLLNGVTYDTFFRLFLINEFVDHIIISLGAAGWFVLSLRKKPGLVMCAVFGISVALPVVGGLSTIIVGVTAILSIPVIISLVICNKYSAIKVLNVRSNLSLNYLALVVTGTGMITVILTSLKIFSIPMPRIEHDYAVDIFILFNSISPLLMVLLIFCFPVKVIATKLTKRSRIHIDSEISSSPPAIKTVRLKYGAITLLLVMLLSVALAVVPHLPTINRNNQQVGTDTSYYVEWQNNLTHAKNTQDFIHDIFAKIRGGDRPLSLLLIFGTVKIVPLEPSFVIDNLPVILGPALVLVAYIFTRELTSNERISLLAAFLTAVSFQVLVGIYAGYYANWIALIFGYLSFVFLLRSLNKLTRLNFFLYAMFSVLLLFSHEYTWTILSIVMGVFLAVMLALGHHKRLNAIVLFLVVVSTVILDIAKTSMIGLSNGFTKDISVAHGYQAGINQFANRWNNLKATMQQYYAAQFSNFIILALALYWLLRSKWSETSNILLMIFLSVGIPPLFFGDWVIQSRVFYDIPFQIPAAIGLGYVGTRHNGLLMLLLISVWLIAMSVRSVYNFIFPS